MTNRLHPWLEAAFAAIALFLGFCYLQNLDWGTPSAAKHQRIFAQEGELQRYVPRMAELRQKFYSTMNEMLDPNQPFKEKFDALYYEFNSNEPFSVLTEDQVLDRTRGYLVGVINSDEQNTIQAISKLNPLKLKFNPGLNTFYGGFYYYTCGALLGAGKVLGLVELVPDPQYYFYHPEQTRSLYRIVRFLGTLSVLLIAAGLVFWMRRLYGPAFAWLSTLFFLSIPLLVPFSHMAKAHLYGTLLVFAGFLCLARTLESPSAKWELLGSLLLGLAAGSIITNLSVGVIIFLMAWARNDWKLAPVFKEISFYAGCALFFAAYAATNYFILLDFAQFQRGVLALQEYTKGYNNAYGKLNLATWGMVVKDLFWSQVNLSFLPLILVGFYAAWEKRDKFLIVALVTALTLTLINLLATRHPGVNIRIFPFLAMFAAAGTLWLWERFPKAKAAVGAYAGAALLLSSLHAMFYFGLFKEPSHLDEAGDWVAKNIPQGESIGVVGGRFYQEGFPAFPFLQYKLVQVPPAAYEGAVPANENLPNYVIWTETKHPILEAYYRPVAQWQKPTHYLGIPFPPGHVISGNATLYIFKKS